MAVKFLPEAKTRLAGGADDRAELVLAMLTDVLAVVVDAGLIPLVVTPDPRITAAAHNSGAFTADEPDHAARPGGGLNAAFTHGQHTLVAQNPQVRSVVLLQADLPAITATQLRAVIARHAESTDPAHRQSFVTDSAGTGTAALLRPVEITSAPHFGANSADAHRTSGALDTVALTPASTDLWAGLRRDVDTLADLAKAAEIGVGPATAAWLRARS